MFKANILIVEDDTYICDFLKTELCDRGFNCYTCETIKELKVKIALNSINIIVTNMHLKDGNALDVIALANNRKHNIPSLVITGYGSVSSAVEAMKCGATDYIEKPLDIDRLEGSIAKALQGKVLKDLCVKDTILKSNVKESLEFNDIIFCSDAMKKLLYKIKKIACSGASIFLQGESGVGKEVIAKIIHKYSGRSSEKFISINCAAVPDALVESEFFGHKKGSFTGADSDRIGKFEHANKGTLLLDEITEMPKHLQAKLLRVIQEKTVNKVGSNVSNDIDVRFLATSNRDMAKAIKSGDFREDLFYRLNVFEINIPPLRERLDDIVPLATMFIEKFCKQYKKTPVKLDPVTVKQLKKYLWPGNVRELANVMERSVILHNNKPYIKLAFRQ